MLQSHVELVVVLCQIDCYCRSGCLLANIYIYNPVNYSEIIILIRYKIKHSGLLKKALLIMVLVKCLVQVEFSGQLC